MSEPLLDKIDALLLLLESESSDSSKDKLSDNPDRAEFYVSDDDFRRASREITEWIIQYRHDLCANKFPVFPTNKTGCLTDLFGESFPDKKNDLSGLMNDLNSKIIPSMTHWESPNFYGWLKVYQSAYHNVLANMLMAGLGTVSFTWQSNPSATELELVVLRWFADLLNLPATFTPEHATLSYTASEALICCMLAAKERMVDKLQQTQATCSLDFSTILNRLVIFSSDQTHFSLLKGCKIIGIPLKNVYRVACTSESNYGLTAQNLENELRKHAKEFESMRMIPFFVCLNIGTTSSGAVDDVQGVTRMLKATPFLPSYFKDSAFSDGSVWVHVDGAFGLSFACLPSMKWLLKGLEEADSVNVNGHKYLMIHQGISFLYLKDSAYLTEALSLHHDLQEYMKNKGIENKKNPSAGAEEEKASSFDVRHINHKDFQLPLGKPFRSLKCLCAARMMGKTGFIRSLERKLFLAQKLEDLLRSDPRLRVCAHRYFDLVTFRMKDKSDEENECLLNLINDDGKIFLIHTKLEGVFVLRMAVGGIEIDSDDRITFAFDQIQENMKAFF